MTGPVETGDGSVQGLSQETTSYYGWLNWLCYNVSLPDFALWSKT